MPRLTPQQLYVANLRGDFPHGAIGYMPKKEALAELVRLTGCDFGTDVAEWEKWLRKHPKKLPRRVRTVAEALRAARALKAKDT